MKKITACLLALLMLVSLSATAFAEDPAPEPPVGDIIITNTNSNHTYLAYEIIAGNISTQTGMPKIDNPWWGCNVTDAGKQAILNHYGISFSTDPGSDDYYDTPMGTMNPKVAALAEKLDGTGAAGAREFASFIMDSSHDAYVYANGKTVEFPASGNTATLDVHHQGYYVVADKPDTLEGKIDSSYTDYIMVVVADQDVTVAHKNDVPVLIKKVQENTAISADTIDPRLPNQTLTERYNDTADYSIGDKIPYELVSSLPKHLDEYNTYKMIFSDSMNGMHYDPSSLKVYVIHTTGNDQVDSSAYKYNVSNPKNISVTLEMARNAAGKFEVKTTTGTTIVDAGSFIMVRYNAVLDETAVTGAAGNENTAYLEYSNNPTKADDMGKTTSDETIVYTYELDIIKTNAESHSPLSGAKFVIQKSNGSAPDAAAYAVLAEIKGTPAKEGEEAPTIGYRVTGWSTSGTQVATDEDGKIKVVGLDKGHYFLTEKEAPEGYSLLPSPIEIAIGANIGNTQTWNGNSTLSSLTLSVTDPNKMSGAVDDGAGDLNKGSVGINVANNATAQLPTTGGMGTTLFYLIGAIMVIGAGVVLITRRRIGRN